jgi:hypothetical protein
MMNGLHWKGDGHPVDEFTTFKERKGSFLFS